MMRINKYLANCGVASRRTADKLVEAGRVKVNDQIIDMPGYMVDEQSDCVKYDDNIIVPVTDQTWVALNKPAGYLTSRSDPHHDKIVYNLLRDLTNRVYPVGRLDLDTEGILLLTNDGELAHRLTHPRYEVPKIYQARVKGRVLPQTLDKFPAGIELPDGKIGHAKSEIKGTGTNFTDLILTLTEGRKREVKHLCRAVGHPVIKLKRLEFAGVTCTGLELGQWRYLTAGEVASLRKLAEAAAKEG